MNLRDLEYLVALDEHRHFGRAAAAAYVSQPTLSTQIKKLENELGVDLIERGTRQVLFTAVGERVVRRARRVLAEVDEIRTLAEGARSPSAGRVKIGVFPTLGAYLLPHLIGPLGERFPELDLFLMEDKTEVLLAQLRSGVLDVALIALPVPDDDLHAEPLFREDFVLAAPSGHRLLDDSEPLSAGELGADELLLLTEGHCLRDQALEVCRAAGASEMKGFRATSLETLRHMVGAGIGLTLLPRLAVSGPGGPGHGVGVREFAAPAPHRDIALVWRRTHVHRELLADLAQALREIISTAAIPVAPLPER